MERIPDALQPLAADAPGMARAARMLAQPHAAPGASAPAAGFADMLGDAVKSVQQAQGEAASLQQAYQMGVPEVGLEQTMIAMNQASLSFQMLAQARNRVVSAYTDIMNMPV
ncbi:hypothetical protein GCM10023144_44320 [Pigmentiphaga soli]|uniref:Flagellar hook-basal body complex protein FliE n=1 Tax=Pigmentiphaga soli TaxID=1007095 RepID=A0ABP8HPQ8_9BURK